MNGISRGSVVSLALLTFVWPPLLRAAGKPLFWGHLSPGRFSVGFRAVHAGPGREFHVWYPAVASSLPPLTMADYLRLSRDLRGSVDNFARDDAALSKTLEMAITGRTDLIDRSRLQEILNTAGAAQQNARPATGRFPLVLWTHRYAITAAQSVLNEYLASYGFVVLYAPAPEPPVLPYEFETEPENVRELQRQVQRLRSALAFARTMPNVQANAVAVMAWSYAGESAYALQQAEPSVRVVVSLSSNVLEGWVYRQAPAAPEPARMRVPYILIDGGNKKPPAALSNAAASTFFISIGAMAHGSFNVLEGMAPSVLGITTVPAWSKAGPDQQIGYEVSAQYVRRSLEHYLVAVPTMDTPFRLWNPDGELREGFVQVTEGGTAPKPPHQDFGKRNFKE